MSEASNAIQMHLMGQAERYINSMIPPGGISTFGDPSSIAVSGLGSEDLLTKGGSASFGHISMGDLGQSDLTDGGSDAFGQFLVAAPGETVLPEVEGFAGDLMPGVFGMGSLGRWRPFSRNRVANRIKTILLNKKKKAKKVLKNAASEVKKNEGKANVLKKRAMKRSVGPVQRDDLLKQAQILEERAKKLRQIAAGAAREAVAPRITREEAKQAIKPVVKEVSNQVAKSGQKTIRKIGKMVKGAPPAWKQRLVSKIGKKQIKDSIAKDIVGSSKMSLWDRFRFGISTKPTKTMSGLETVTNPTETADIVDDWRSDDIYGEPLGL